MYLLFKRLFDILFGVCGLVLLLPVCAILKIALLFTGDRGKLLYQQERVGKDGRIIKIYKFRSMVVDSQEQLEELLKDEHYRREWEETQKIEDDPRITKIGHYLRKTSLDELPQLLNVIKGDMSLVGPRPLVPGELQLHGGSPLYWQVKPGITGWWACHGRSDINYKERLEMEYYYVNNCSLKLDIICIYKTVIAVLEQKGAK